KHADAHECQQETAAESDFSAAAGPGVGENFTLHRPLRRADPESADIGLFEKADFAVVTLRTDVKRKRHAVRCVLDRNASCGRMSLRKLTEIAENGLGHGIHGISTQTLATEIKIHPCRSLDIL